MLPRGLFNLLKVMSLRRKPVSELGENLINKPINRAYAREGIDMAPISKVDETKSGLSALSQKYDTPEENILKLTGGKGKDIEMRSPVEVRTAAEQLKRGEITSKEFRKIRDEKMPRTVFEEVPEETSDLLMYKALDEGKKDKIIGLTKNIYQDQPVGLRLDIPAYKKHRVFVPTVHEPSGKTIGHISAAYLKGTLNKDGTRNLVQLKPSSKKSIKTASEKISKKTGEISHGEKSPYATIDGAIQDVKPSNVVDYAKRVRNSDEWTEIGFNPDRGGSFFNKKTGQPILEAEEIVQVGEMVLAKGARKPTISQLKSLAVDTPKGKRIFAKAGGMVEKNTYNYNTQRTI